MMAPHNACDMEEHGEYSALQLARWAIFGDPLSKNPVLPWEVDLVNRVEQAIVMALKQRKGERI